MLEGMRCEVRVELLLSSKRQPTYRTSISDVKEMGSTHQTPVGPQFSSPSPLYPPLAWVSDQLGLSSPSELSPVEPGLRSLPSSCILSHIKHPESAFLEARVPVCRGISLSETVSQVPPRGNPDILQQFQRTSALTIRFELLSLPRSPLTNQLSDVGIRLRCNPLRHCFRPYKRFWKSLERVLLYCR